jgi:dTDP-4-dehydrorhamnose 3,5-epimerase
MIKAIRAGNWENPSANLSAETFVLNENESNILVLPQGYVNGFKALEENSKLMVFSNMDNDESAKDLIRFPLDYWKF